MKLALSPRQSLRFGMSIEINPLGDQKVCSYNCVYCNLGPTEIRMNQVKKQMEFPSVDAIESALREIITESVTQNTSIDSLLVSGNGEPTLHLEIDQLTERLRKVQQEVLPNAKLIILTNGAHIENRRTVETLNLYDERVIKIDAASETGFKAVNAPLIRGNMSKVTSGARKLSDCIIQSVFFQGQNSNLDADELDEWMEVVGIVKPKSIHIHTLAKDSTNNPEISPATEDELYTILSKFQRKSNIEIKVFYDPEATYI